VDERLLWIPSLGRIRGDELQIESAAYAEFFRKKTLASLYQDLLENSLLWVLAGLLFSYLIICRRKFRAKLREYGTAAAKRNCTSFIPTVLSLCYSLLIAAPIPLLVWFVYGRASGSGCPQAAVDGLRSLGGFFTVMIFFRVLTQPGGLLVKHLRMDEKRVQVIRKGLNWFIPVMPLFLFFAIALPNESGANSGGRLTFIALVVILMILFEQVLRPGKKLIYWQGRPSNRFAKACYGLALVVPLALIVGAVIGYYASVQELRIQVLMSVGQILFTLLVAGILYRWILVSRRRLAVEQAMKRRAVALAEKEKENKDAAPGEKPQNVASVEEVMASAVKVVEVEEQTNRLVRAAAITVIAFGLLGIWRSAIPALSALDRVTLWEEKAQPAGDSRGLALPNPLSVIKTTEASEDRKSSSSAERENDANSEVSHITLQDLFVSFVILLLTFVAAKNIPGLLELAVFRHMDLAPGSCFAFTTTMRYMIVVIGIIMAFGNIGIDWGKVQWIAAAVTLGIGFGLQEIFANFVAGLIILFERPIRLGDIVTIAGVDGKVTQIRIRATTVRQFNNRELIVPNKEFITGQLVNWTLSDNVLRTDIPVGIAYGSDTELARKLLLEAATNNPRVLKDPEPTVVFDNFADSSLSFILRVHIAGIEDLLPAKSELHFTVDKSFREAGIEISFPQTDIHIRSIPEKLPIQKLYQEPVEQVPASDIGD
jgi:potassium efflux system protein